jgi:hypothetical protein
VDLLSGRIAMRPDLVLKIPPIRYSLYSFYMETS